MFRNIVRLLTVFTLFSLFVATGFAQAAGSTQSGPAAKKSMKKGATTPKSKQVDINSATKEQLTAVGLDDATSQKIIDSRPYKTKRDLETKKILTKEQYAQVKDKLVAHGGRASHKGGKKASGTGK
ncbi:MAG TPA: helix-hairpin-helix domain-containing protein [Candidatus Limnocylindrales bacterium]|nr:helix-hairpin-helix domain-containing protein [Candidatus Limnocylindrales bacterium]